MKPYLLLLLVPAVICGRASTAQMQILATSPSTIGSSIPGYSGVTTISTVTLNYTPSTPPAEKTPIDEDSTTEDPLLYDYADLLTVNYTMSNGNITTTSAGKVWTLRIAVTNAVNVGFSFNLFNLSSTAQLFVFNEERSVMIGPVKKSQFTNSTAVSIVPMPGDKIIIYVLEPGNVGTFQSVVSVNRVEAGYMPVDQPGSTGVTILSHTDCIPNLLCGGNQISGRAVARIFVDGFWGTGTLLNNQSENGRPLVLTAYHLLDNDRVFGYPVGNGNIDADEIFSLARARFQFGFWRTACNGSTNANTPFYTGAVIRAQWRNSDMILLELLNPPWVGDGVNYAGWNRGSAAPDGANSYIIHHPRHVDMRWTKTKNVKSYINGNFWSAHYSQGVVMRGSSGAGLFNPQGQVVGQLRSGWSSCHFTDFGDRYGKIERSWSGGLGPLLSPSGAISQNALVLHPLTIGGPTAIPCGTSGHQYTVPPLTGCTFNWVVSGNLTIASGQNTRTLTVNVPNATTPATGFVRITINDNKGNIRTLTSTLNVSIGPPPVPTIQILGIAPLPNTQMDVSVTTSAPPPYKWFVDNVLVRTASTTQTTINGGGCGQHTLRVEVANSCGTNSNSTGYTRQCAIFAVNPNPASDEMQVSLSDEGASSMATSAETPTFSRIMIYNRKGDLVTQLSYPTGTSSVRIPVSSWITDTYIVRILTQFGWEEHKIIVSRL
jgi:hypothetical protein